MKVFAAGPEEAGYCRVISSVMCGWALKPSLAASPARSTILAKPAEVKGAPRSDVTTNRDLGILLSGETAQCAQLVTQDKMGAMPTFLGPANGQRGGFKDYLIPAQVYQLACPNPVPVRHKDHGRIPKAT